ncbi:MAG: hypothetical protein CM1200mP41_39570 [Gammaproteobacteria bacterium]|nr:MAG: hypothetical protein CM1200mP41_39570 [Gammaproteobacteria bacterium]
MLQRIYGTAWALERTQSLPASNRGGRKAGPSADWRQLIFPFPGGGPWHGVLASRWLDTVPIAGKLIREMLLENDYQEVFTPQMLDRSLWERSGHWEKFRDHMFTTHVDDRTTPLSL